MGLIARIKDYLFDRRNVIEIESLEVDGNTVPLDELINKKLYYHNLRFDFTYNGSNMRINVGVYTNIKEQITDSNVISKVFQSLYNGGVMLLIDDNNIIFSTSQFMIGNAGLFVPLTYNIKKAFIGETQYYLERYRNQDVYKVYICLPDTINLTTGEINEKSFTAYDLTYVSDTVTEL